MGGFGGLRSEQAFRLTLHISALWRIGGIGMIWPELGGGLLTC
jgi:hypothetical protein